MPVPYLLLKHKDPLLKDFVWHWFLLVGYEDFEDTFMVKTVTYGEYQWMDLKICGTLGIRERRPHHCGSAPSRILPGKSPGGNLAQNIIRNEKILI